MAAALSDISEEVVRISNSELEVSVDPSIDSQEELFNSCRRRTFVNFTTDVSGRKRKMSPINIM